MTAGSSRVFVAEEGRGGLVCDRNERGCSTRQARAYLLGAVPDQVERRITTSSAPARGWAFQSAWARAIWSSRCASPNPWRDRPYRYRAAAEEGAAGERGGPQDAATRAPAAQKPATYTVPAARAHASARGTRLPTSTSMRSTEWGRSVRPY